LKRNYFGSIFTLIFLFTDGFDLAPAPGGTMSYGNVGLIYLIFLLINGKSRGIICFSKNMIERQFSRLGVFFILSCFFSYFYYEFPAFEIMRVVKWIIPFWSVYLFRLLKRDDFHRMMRLLLNITIILNIIFIVQCLTGVIIFNYYTDHVSVNSSGFYRFYNKPIFSTFFLFYLIYNRGQYKKWIYRISVLILCAALLLTLNRMEIIAVMLGYIICLFVVPEMKNKISKVILICLFTIPVITIFELRDKDSSNGTSGRDDIAILLKGGFKDYTYDGHSEGGTMTFRIAMMYERIMYIKDRNIAEIAFGLGLGHSDCERTQKLYDFKIGTFTASNVAVRVSQLSTADFAWVGMLCQWGILGMSLFCMMFYRLFHFFFSCRNNTWALVCVGYLIYLIVCSFAGSFSVEANMYLLPFMTYYYLLECRKTMAKL